MDELRIESEKTKSIISRLLMKAVCDKLGCDIGFNLNEVNIKIIDGEVQMHLNADANLSEDELDRILKKVGI